MIHRAQDLFSLTDCAPRSNILTFRYTNSFDFLSPILQITLPHFVVYGDPDVYKCRSPSSSDGAYHLAELSLHILTYYQKKQQKTATMGGKGDGKPRKPVYWICKRCSSADPQKIELVPACINGGCSGRATDYNAVKLDKHKQTIK